MCGIAGIFAYGQAAPPVDEGELLRIREAMITRGPDGKGLWMSSDGRTGLAHRRLAIIDVGETGAQPMTTAGGRYRITFNGEIYNYRELRQGLLAKGCVFRSNSDTEVLLHLYEERGEAMVHALRGMYAFGIYDSVDRTLFLARDPFGIKPLYFADDGESFRFASQVKALLKGGAVDTGPSAAGNVGFYLWGHLPDPHTLYEGIKGLEAGSTMLVGARGARGPRRYFKIADEFATANAMAAGLSPESSRESLHAALRDSVRHHLVADVPVGVFLSSGLDSTTLAALAAEASQGEIRTITLGFDEYRGTRDDETPLASLVARAYGTAHRTRWVSREDFAACVEDICEAMDQPSVDGVNTYFVSRAASEAGMKVAISGVGGDELFGGYPSFRDLPSMARAFGSLQRFPRLGRGFRIVSAPFLKRFTSPKYAGLLEYGGSYAGAYLLRRGLYMPWELPEFLDGELVRRGWAELQTLLRLEETVIGVDSDFQKVSALELGWYMRNQLLRDADWAGMAHSLEIRVPLVDIELFRRVAPLAFAGGGTKRDMAGAPSTPLPQEVLRRRKTGFSIPVRDWMDHAGSGKVLPRGTRGWARRIHPAPPKPRRALALVTDAFGGHGGIAKFNRDFLRAACSDPNCAAVVALPRLMPLPPGPLPDKLTYLACAADGKLRYVTRVLGVLLKCRSFDLILCGHVNILPVAWLARLLTGGRLVLIVHGIDAWKPTRNPVTDFLVKRIDSFISVSALTSRRFTAWTGIDGERGLLLPNSIDLEAFAPGPKSDSLLQKYGLRDKVIIMTMGRLASTEQYKGFDEVLEVLPDLVAEIPDLAYVIAGSGDDQARLREKAERLGLADRVVFTGLVPESMKRDYFNLADAFVMPSRGEGFGIVFLEAMACGIPVVGSAVDGSAEALRDGMLGELADPADAASIKRAIRSALKRPRKVPEGLDHFSYANFERRVHQMLDRW